MTNIRDARDAFDVYVYKVSKGTRSIKQTYKKPSAVKQDIYTRITKACLELNGRYCSVITHNYHYFTAGFIYIKDGGYTFRYYTPRSVQELRLCPHELALAKREGLIVCNE